MEGSDRHKGDEVEVEMKDDTEGGGRVRDG